MKLHFAFMSVDALKGIRRECEGDRRADVQGRDVEHGKARKVVLTKIAPGIDFERDILRLVFRDHYRKLIQDFFHENMKLNL